MKTIIGISISFIIGIAIGFGGRKLYFETEIFAKQYQKPAKIKNKVQNKLADYNMKDMFDDDYFNNFGPV